MTFDLGHILHGFWVAFSLAIADFTIMSLKNMIYRFPFLFVGFGFGHLSDLLL